MKRTATLISLAFVLSGCGDDAAPTADAPAPAEPAAVEATPAAPAASSSSPVAKEVRSYLKTIGMAKRYGITKVVADGGDVTITTKVGNDSDGQAALTGICTETVSPLDPEGPAVDGVEYVTVLGVGTADQGDVIGECERP